MLTGRESLVHLIGRRRSTLLSAHLAVVLLSPSRSTSLLQADDAGAGMGEAKGEAAVVAPSLFGGSAGSEQVACPVCREFIPGSDYCINSSTPTSSPESVEHSLLLYMPHERTEMEVLEQLSRFQIQYKNS
ncbi:fanconi-associated nuclease 1 homolog [Hordeum vulgare subsp. vulgare]|uniref:fanconi-associated nuclease 1 homolog n=1 Tax=Hordeum vulgare subsp. vulgare TaxID=112509 RepID=UPI001D1A58B1|nr:fanconi-associated nuclease 1 homolog [Hordeum vulgare subsp. vulgare]